MARLFRRILVPHDFSDEASTALALAAELARGHDGRLLVLHALTPFYGVPSFPPSEQVAWIPPAGLERETKARLEALVARVLGRRAPASRCRVVVGDAYQAIMDAARDADAIVMATVGRTGLAHLLIGSVTEKVVRHSPIPVLTVRVGKTRRGAAGARRQVGARRARRGRRAGGDRRRR